MRHRGTDGRRKNKSVNGLEIKEVKLQRRDDMQRNKWMLLENHFLILTWEGFTSGLYKFFTALPNI